jgi:pyruvate-ferredoxin/flavodoxin oxidoreductase
VAHRWVILDGNEAAVSIAYRLSELVAIYPTVAASPMGARSAAWARQRQPNLWGTIPRVVQLNRESSAAGALHGAVQAGALATTFTASQGLLVMLPSMFKMAGELSPAVIHVAARAVAVHARAHAGDHSDVMAARSAGWAMLASASVQEAHDLAFVAHAASLETRIPFVHFFDGFRTSHELSRIAALGDADLRAMLDEHTVASHRARALTPDHPVLRGTAEHSDIFFQGREAANPFYESCPARVQRVMDRFAIITGRRYRLFDYVGSADADRVIVMMGSGAGAAAETVSALRAKGHRVGLLKVRLFRPFSAAHLLAALPRSVRAIAVLDRTKEPGAAGEPLYQDVVTAIAEARASGESPFDRTPRVIGGRYGLGSKEFTPAMAEAVFQELTYREPTPRFSVGIVDDVSFKSLPCDDTFTTEPDEVTRVLVYGTATDRMADAAVASLKMVAGATGRYAQAFVEESQKPDSMTVSHLRFGPHRIESSYLIDRAQLIVCSNWDTLNRVDVLERAAYGGIVLLNVPFEPMNAWRKLPARVRDHIIQRRLQAYVIDAAAVAAACGLGPRIDTVLQTCFLALSDLLPREAVISAMKEAGRTAYASKGEHAVRRSEDAVDDALAALRPVVVGEDHLPETLEGGEASTMLYGTPGVVRATIATMLAGEGDTIPVSLIPADGTYPIGPSPCEKRELSDEIPVWQEEVCIQCGKCALVCPHASIRIKIFEPEHLADAPTAFKSTDYRGKDYAGLRYTIQVAPDDCTGCRLCVDVCPARHSATSLRALEMQPQRARRERERENFAFFLSLPELDRRMVKTGTVKGSQLLQPLFEFSAACVGCGETPYLKLVSQLFGDRMVVANAIGCSSITGATRSTAPWTCNLDGRGPAWASSLVDDAAECGYGMRLAIDTRADEARALVANLRDVIGETLADSLLNAAQVSEADIYEQRSRVVALRERLSAFVEGAGRRDIRDRAARRLLASTDYLVKKSVWIIGDDGWAYDGGYDGVNCVLASGANVNILVLDTAVNAKAVRDGASAGLRTAPTPLAAVGRVPKKDPGLLALAYRNVYVAHVALGANDTQAIKALLEAESYDGPSLVIAYAHCPGAAPEPDHGLEQQRRAVTFGHWPLFRYDPRRATTGDRRFVLDSQPIPFGAGVGDEKSSAQADDPGAAALAAAAGADVGARWKIYWALAGRN